MKKVKHVFSSDSKKVYRKKCAAVFSAAAIAFTSLTFSVHYSAEAKASENENSIGSQETLELSESFLSLNAGSMVSVFELTGTPVPESESVVFVDGLSTGSERNMDVTTEKTTQKVADDTKTQGSAGEDGQYTFEELGLTQISDMDVPDDILFDENGIPLNYSKKLTGRSTAYSMGHTTATGTSVREGVVAVNPRNIPYGSKMYIVADDGSVYGYCSAEDTGSFIHWKNAPTVDLYMNSKSFARQWGNRAVTIYIF